MSGKISESFTLLIYYLVQMVRLHNYKPKSNYEGINCKFAIWLPPEPFDGNNYSDRLNKRSQQKYWFHMIVLSWQSSVTM